jgi:hypothetical protein
MLACAALCGAAACRDFTIDAGRVIVIEIANTAPTVQEGDTLRLSARLLNAAGNPVAGASATWAVADTMPGFTLDSMTGLVTGITAGTWRVFARFENLRTDPLKLTVTPVPTPAGCCGPGAAPQIRPSSRAP